MLSNYAETNAVISVRTWKSIKALCCIKFPSRPHSEENLYFSFFSSCSMPGLSPYLDCRVWWMCKVLKTSQKSVHWTCRWEKLKEGMGIQYLRLPLGSKKKSNTQHPEHKHFRNIKSCNHSPLCQVFDLFQDLNKNVNTDDVLYSVYIWEYSAAFGNLEKLQVSISFYFE